MSSGITAKIHLYSFTVFTARLEHNTRKQRNVNSELTQSKLWMLLGVLQAAANQIVALFAPRLAGVRAMEGR